METLEVCPVCHEDSAYLEYEGGWCVYAQCPVCGTHTAFCQFSNEEEKEQAEKNAAFLWNAAKVIAEGRSE